MTSCNKSGGVQCDKRKKKIESALVFQTSFHSSFYFSFFSRLQPSPFSASTCCTFCLLSTTMVVSVDVRKLIVKWHNEGLSNRAIAKLIDHDTTTVGNILKQFKTEGSLVPHHSSGRPRELSEREERHAARLLKTEHGIPATAIAAELSEAHGKKINPNAVRQSLHRQGFFNAKMAVKPKLTKGAPGVCAPIRRNALRLLALRHLLGRVSLPRAPYQEGEVHLEKSWGKIGGRDGDPCC